MLSGLTKAFRRKAAIAFAALYALCVLAPAVALAFVDGPTAVHCLTDQHGMARAHDHEGTVHGHADGTAHRHHDGGGAHEHSEADGKSHAGNCCGLFCLTALAGDAIAALSTPVRFTLTAPAPDDRLTGRGPDRINRPPIA
jgi:hypothetical protein